MSTKHRLMTNFLKSMAALTLLSNAGCKQDAKPIFTEGDNGFYTHMYYDPQETGGFSQLELSKNGGEFDNKRVVGGESLLIHFQDIKGQIPGVPEENEIVRTIYTYDVTDSTFVEAEYKGPQFGRKPNDNYGEQIIVGPPREEAEKFYKQFKTEKEAWNAGPGRALNKPRP